MGVWQNYKGSLGEGRRPCIKNRKEYGKENCIDRSEIPPIIIDFDDEESSDEES
jgi:hypothetical protein